MHNLNLNYHFIKCCFIILLLSILTSCEKQINEPNISNDNEKLLDNLVNVGFRYDMIEDKGDYFLVENDLVITKGEISQFDFDCDKWNKLAKTTQYATAGVVNYNKVINITVEIHSSLNGTGWDTAIRESISEWNNISDCRITLSEYSNTPIHDNPNIDPGRIEGLKKINTTSDILIAQSQSLALPTCMRFTSQNLIALARFPSNGNPGPHISVNTYFNFYSSSQKKFIIVHELGHCLGFRHTNWVALGEGYNGQGSCEYVYGANMLVGTPTTDPNSVMNGATGGTSWNGFTNYDQIGSRALYPSQLTGTFSRWWRQFNYQTQEYDYYYEWSRISSTPFTSAVQMQSYENGNWIDISLNCVGTYTSTTFVDRCGEIVTGGTYRAKIRNYANDYTGYTQQWTKQ